MKAPSRRTKAVVRPQPTPDHTKGTEPTKAPQPMNIYIQPANHVEPS